MKKQKLIFLSSAFVAALLMTGCGQTKASSAPVSEASTQTSTSKTTTSSTTSKGTSSSSSSSVVEVTKVTSLTITNKATLEKTWYLNLQQDLTIELTASKGKAAVTLTAEEALKQGLITITSNKADVLEVSGLGVTAKALGAATITVANAAGDVTASFAAKVVDRTANAMCIILGSVTEGDLVEDDVYTLPTAKAYLADGTDVTSSLTLADSTGDAVALSDETYTPKTLGKHTLTYTIVDPADATKKVTETKEYTLYKKILGAGGGALTVHDEKTANPYITVDKSGIELAGMYVAPSKLYYAEATFDAASTTNLNTLVALNHMVTTTKGGNSTQYLYNGFKVNGSGGWEGANKYNETGWNPLGETSWEAQDLYTRRSDPITFAPFTGTFTLAVAREGSLFHFFINGKRAYSYISSDLADVDTVPGIVMTGNDTATPNYHYDGKISNIVELTGDDAKSKIATLSSSFHADYYGAWDGGGGVWSVSAGNGVFTGDGYGYSADNGYAFGYNSTVLTQNNQNRSMISPLIYMQGGFQMDFDVKVNALENSGWGKFYVDLRSVRDQKEVLGFDTVFSSLKASISEFNQNSYVSDFAKFTTYPTISEVQTALGNDLGGILKVQIKRQIDLLQGAKYTITLTSGSDSTKTLTYESGFFSNTYCSEPQVAFFKSEKAQVDILNFKVATLPYLS